MRINLSILEVETIIAALNLMGDRDNTGTRELLLDDLKERVKEEKARKTTIFPWRRLWPF